MSRDVQDLGVRVVENTNALLGYWDKNLICRFANRAYKDWLGVLPEDLINRVTLQDFLGPVFNKYLPIIRNVLEGKVQVFERDLKSPTGGIRRAVVTYTPDIVDDLVEGFYVHAADISPRQEYADLNAFSGRAHAFKTIKTLQMNLLSKFPGIEQLAKDEGISSFKLKRIFQQETGQSPFAYYRKLQMDFAYSYLNENRCSRKQMAAMLNFANPSNFSVCYNNYLTNKHNEKLQEHLSRVGEERYRIFIEQSPLAIAMLDTDKRILAISKKWVTLRPSQQIDVFGKNLFDVYKQLSDYKSHISEALKGKSTYMFEDPTRKSDIKTSLKWKFDPWYIREGEIGGIMVYAEEVKLEHDIFKASKEHSILAEISKAMHIGVWERNIQTGEEFWSDVVYDILGFPRSEKMSLETLIKSCVSVSGKKQITTLLAGNITETFTLNTCLTIQSSDTTILKIHFIARRSAASPVIAGTVMIASAKALSEAGDQLLQA